jgi:signal transduction histidine kinase
MNKIKEFTKNRRANTELTVIIFFAIIVFVLAMALDIFEPLVELIISYRHPWRLDELALALIILPLPFVYYLLQRRQELRQEIAERIRAESLLAKQEETLSQYAQRLENLHMIDRAILTAQSPTDIANKALQYICQLTPCLWAKIIMFDNENQRTTLLTSSSLDKQPPLPVEISLKQSELTSELREGQILVIKDPSQAKTCPCHQLCSQQPNHLCLNIPLISEGELLGLLNLGSNLADSFTPEVIAIVHEVAIQLTIAFQNANLFEKVKEGHSRLQVLSQSLVESQENERRHIARELHDEVGQALTAVKINLQATRRISGTTCPVNHHIDESIKVVEDTLQQVRNIALDLRPSLLDDLGLLAALRWYLDRLGQRTGLNVQFNTDLPEIRLSPNLETICFRIAQEALTNVVRHAQASLVLIQLELVDTNLYLSIQDDGRGFDVRSALQQSGQSLGLSGMQERARLAEGQLEIESSASNGTTLRVCFPLPELQTALYQERELTFYE